MCLFCSFFFFKQKTAYEMRISDWSPDVCSSDLLSRQDMAASLAVGPDAEARRRCAAGHAALDAIGHPHHRGTVATRHRNAPCIERAPPAGVQAIIVGVEDRHELGKA